MAVAVAVAAAAVGAAALAGSAHCSARQTDWLFAVAGSAHCLLYRIERSWLTAVAVELEIGWLRKSFLQREKGLLVGIVVMAAKTGSSVVAG